MKSCIFNVSLFVFFLKINFKWIDSLPQTQIVESFYLGMKYQRFTSSGYKDIWVCGKYSVPFLFTYINIYRPGTAQK